MKIVKVYKTLRKRDDKTALKYKILYSTYFFSIGVKLSNIQLNNMIFLVNFDFVHLCPDNIG